MILDSSFIIDLLAGDRGAKVRLDEVAADLLVVPTLVYTEVAIGIGPDTDQARTFDEVMELVTLAPYDAESARRAVDLQRQLRRDGDQIGAIDAMTAGMAIARDDRILTRNLAEFERTPARISPY